VIDQHPPPPGVIALTCSEIATVRGPGRPAGR
jgi:hypothetical protein